MKFLLNDRSSCMRTELISVELKIRLNFTLSCTEMYKYVLDSKYLSKAIKSNDQRNCANRFFYSDLIKYLFPLIFIKQKTNCFQQSTFRCFPFDFSPHPFSSFYPVKKCQIILEDYHRIFVQQNFDDNLLI